MSTIASLSPHTGTQPNASSVDDQIKALEKRIAEGVKDGSIPPRQADALSKALDDIQKAVDAGGNAGKPSGADLRKIGQMLREIAKTLSGVGRGKTESATSAADSDGDNDGSGGVATLA